MEHDEQHDGFEREEWWLAAPEHLMVWARLRVLASGVAIRMALKVDPAEAIG